MTDTKSGNDPVEQALTTAFTYQDSYEFSDQVAVRITQMIYLRYLVLFIGWLTGMSTLLWLYPILKNSLEGMTDLVIGGLPLVSYTQTVTWLIPCLIIVMLSIIPAMLFTKQPRTPG